MKAETNEWGGCGLRRQSEPEPRPISVARPIFHFYRCNKIPPTLGRVVSRMGDVTQKSKNSTGEMIEAKIFSSNVIFELRF